MEEEVKKSYLEAGKIAAEVREYGKGLIKKGSSLLDVTEKIEGKIKSLNADVMCQSNGFRTRLNNLNYFDPTDCTRYYNSAIVNYINELTVKTCVAELEGEIVGYYMLKQIEGNIYKGLMTGVLPKARGAFLQYKMQQFLINHIGHPITLINTTQLSNMAVIKNHIRSKRNLSKIEHIFYKKVGF